MSSRCFRWLHTGIAYFVIKYTAMPGTWLHGLVPGITVFSAGRQAVVCLSACKHVLQCIPLLANRRYLELPCVELSRHTCISRPRMATAVSGFIVCDSFRWGCIEHPSCLQMNSRLSAISQPSVLSFSFLISHFIFPHIHTTPGTVCPAWPSLLPHA